MSESSAKPVLLTMQDIHIDGRSGDTWSPIIKGVDLTLHRGEVIAPDDLMVVRVGLDPALQTVPADHLDAVAGSRAVFDLPAGGLLTPDGFDAGVVPTDGSSVVGVGVVAAPA